MGQSGPLFRLFSSFCQSNVSFTIKNEKSVDGVLGNQTLDPSMVGADKTTEIWWLPQCNKILFGRNLDFHKIKKS